MKIASAAGITPGARYCTLNQDDVTDTKFTYGGKTLYLWGVFDGHAPLGEFASQIARKTIEAEVEKAFKASGQLLSDGKLTKIFEIAHKAVLNFYNDVPKKFVRFGKLLTRSRHKYIDQNLTLSSRSNATHCDWFKCGSGYR